MIKLFSISNLLGRYLFLIHRLKLMLKINILIYTDENIKVSIKEKWQSIVSVNYVTEMQI